MSGRGPCWAGFGRFQRARGRRVPRRGPAGGAASARSAQSVLLKLWAGETGRRGRARAALAPGSPRAWQRAWPRPARPTPEGPWRQRDTRRTLRMRLQRGWRACRGPSRWPVAKAGGPCALRLGHGLPGLHGPRDPGFACWWQRHRRVRCPPRHDRAARPMSAPPTGWCASPTHPTGAWPRSQSRAAAAGPPAATARGRGHVGSWEQFSVGAGLVCWRPACRPQNTPEAQPGAQGVSSGRRRAPWPRRSTGRSAPWAACAGPSERPEGGGALPSDVSGRRRI